MVGSTSIEVNIHVSEVGMISILNDLDHQYAGSTVQFHVSPIWEARGIYYYDKNIMLVIYGLAT